MTNVLEWAAILLSGAAVCRAVPYCLWISCGERPENPYLWEFCGDADRRSRGGL